MNALLIYNSNVPYKLVEDFKQLELGESSSFEVSRSELLLQNFDIDVKMHSFLMDEDIECQNFDVIFVPFSLSKENYTEFLGLRMVLHIRLTKSFNNVQTPVVFYGLDDALEINKISDSGQLLFSKNVYTTDKISGSDFKSQIEYIGKSLNKTTDEEFISEFINKIRVEPPSNYNSHHSIANEWALVRYFSMFQDDELNTKYKELSKKIKELKYLKSLHCKYAESNTQRQLFKHKKHLIAPLISNFNSVTIGLIDDDSGKGWGSFYDYILDKSGGLIRAFEFNDNELQHELVNRIDDWVKNNADIDVFIVDLRLHDDDFLETNIDNLSGIQVIKNIKIANPGKQIIVSTASNKTWYFQKCIDYKVKSFIVKESPETLNSREETKKIITDLIKAIRKGVDNGYLADLYRQIKRIKESNIYRNDDLNKEFQKIVFGNKGLLDQILALLLIDADNDAIVNQCLLLCFQILENYTELNSVSSFGKSKDMSSGYVWTKDNTKFDIFITEDKQYSTMFELEWGVFQFQSKHIETVIGYRVNEKLKTSLSKKNGLDSTTLVKIISVLHYRDGIPQKDIEEIIKLRYYRSNVAAHLTGGIKSDTKKITAKDDIVFMINTFEQIFTEKT